MEKIGELEHEYERGKYLYFCKPEENGKVGVYKAEMHRRKKQNGIN